MSDTLTLAGSVRILPDQSQSDAALSGDFETLVPLNTSLALSRRESVTVIVPEDETPNAQEVSLDLIGDVHFLMIRSDTPIIATINGEPVRVDPLLIQFTETTAITTLTITGTGSAATVRVVLGRV